MHVLGSIFVRKYFKNSRLYVSLLLFIINIRYLHVVFNLHVYILAVSEALKNFIDRLITAGYIFVQRRV